MESASWPTLRVAPRRRSWMRRWRGSRTFATAAPWRPTGAPATEPACSCRSRPRSCRVRGADWRTSFFGTRARERRSSRRASRRASRSRAGGRSRSIPKPSARPHVRACRRSSSSSCCARSACPPTRPSSGPIARAGAPRGLRVRTSPRCRSARSRTRRSARRTSWGRSTRTCARGRSRFRLRSSTSASRPTRARRGSAHSRSGFSATTARSTRSTATCGRCGGASQSLPWPERSRSPARTPRSSTTRSSCSSGEVETSVMRPRCSCPARGRRIRSSIPMWPPSTATTRDSWSRGTGRLRSSSRTGEWSARRSIGTGCGRSAWRPPGRSSPVHPRQARCRSHAPPACAAVASAPASCSPSTPASASRRTPRSRTGWRAGARTVAGSKPAVARSGPVSRSNRPRRT